ncbi:hypothetical protein DY000_02015081 [Brassica cretica]|uniref:TLC domain-containing protein n=1 Tax=Brassica cretica TaxID=69181 RepID=A0ABQ7CXI3_BRACR|nr:hypothetical protein DY000_02015081 [Brassica cretica]
MKTNFSFTADDDAASVSSKQLVLLASICSGILMCKLVYDFAAYISPLRFNAAYPNLTAKLEWNGTTVKGCFFFLHRGFSTFHAVFVSVASIYLLVISDQFDENVHGDSVVNSTTSLSEAVMGISLGYFIADLTMIFWHFPTLGGIEYVRESKNFYFFCAGETSVSTRILQPSYGSTGPVCDESSLVLENHQRIDQNNLQGKTQGVKKR